MWDFIINRKLPNPIKLSSFFIGTTKDQTKKMWRVLADKLSLFQKCISTQYIEQLICVISFQQKVIKNDNFS
jgi:hypothetical protein